MSVTCEGRVQRSGIVDYRTRAPSERTATLFWVDSEGRHAVPGKWFRVDLDTKEAWRYVENGDGLVVFRRDYANECIVFATERVVFSNALEVEFHE